jgi:hypothetical protein
MITRTSCVTANRTGYPFARQKVEYFFALPKPS